MDLVRVNLCLYLYLYLYLYLSEGAQLSSELTASRLLELGSEGIEAAESSPADGSPPVWKMESCDMLRRYLLGDEESFPDLLDSRQVSEALTSITK